MGGARRDWRLLGAFLLVLVAIPFAGPGPYVLHVLILCLLFGVLASSWNLIVGFGGIFTFGHQAFFGIGAYGSALLAMRTGLSPWISAPAAGLIAASAGFLIGLPLLRIRSIAHVAIVSLAFAEIVRITASNATGLTRGELGLWGIPEFPPLDLPGLGRLRFAAADKAPFYGLVVLFAAAALALVQGLVGSRLGLALRAIRDNEDAAESLGVNLARAKLAAFTTGAGLAGLTGAVYAHYVGILTPHSVMDLGLMVQIVAMTLVGGIGTVAGPMLGAFLLVGGLELMRGLSELRLIIYGVLLVVMITLMPEGVLVRVRALLPKPARAGRAETTSEPAP